MNDLLILGCGGHSGPVYEITQLEKKWREIFFINDYPLNKEKIHFGCHVLHGVDSLKKFNVKKTSAFVAIGDNKKRKILFKKLKMIGFKIPNIIHPTSVISKDTKILEGNFIGPLVHIGTKVCIGNGNIVNSFANLEHEVKVGSFCQVGPAANICGKSILKDGIFIGCNATVIDNVKIHNHSIIGAGTVILKSINKPGCKFVGNPGRKI
jgi:sugar O-acyltransferase (sialic acid O-acetyltransferase NeuD family)